MWIVAVLALGVSVVAVVVFRREIRLGAIPRVLLAVLAAAVGCAAALDAVQAWITGAILTVTCATALSVPIIMVAVGLVRMCVVGSVEPLRLGGLK